METAHRAREAAPTLLAAAALAVGALLAPADRRLQAFVLLALLFALWRIGRALVALLVPDLARLSTLVAAFTFAVVFGSVAATAASAATVSQRSRRDHHVEVGASSVGNGRLSSGDGVVA
jgi:uncharacterized membrane protein YwaF